jgi:large subunit ribosomal protein L1
MAKHGKKYRAAAEKVEQRPYQLDEAFGLLKQISFAKFNETVELSMLLGVDPKHADQMVRGTTLLPHGTGQTKRVLVIAQGEKLKEAQDAGADMVGGDDVVEKIQGGWVDFDAVIATPDMMPTVGKLGRVLGPRGLMPNPKSGTVTDDVAKAVTDVKGGRVEYRTDKNGNLHMMIGKKSFSEADLVDNYAAVIDEIYRAKPAAAKGRYVRSVTMSSTMGPGIKIDPQKSKDLAEEMEEAATS